jgi:hypothetical protein
VFSPERIFDVATREAREEMAALVRRYQAIGATVLSLRFKSQSLAHLLEQLEIFAESIAPEFAPTGA